MGAKTKEQHLWDIAEGKYGFGNEMEMRFAQAMAERDAAQASADVDLVAWLTAQRDFSRAAFGPHPRTEGLLRHIASELDEIRQEPTKLEEWVDVAILAFDGAWRAGHEPRAIAEGLVSKFKEITARTWPDWRTKREDEPIEHVKAAQSVAEAGPVVGGVTEDMLDRLGNIFAKHGLSREMEKPIDEWMKAARAARRAQKRVDVETIRFIARNVLLMRHEDAHALLRAIGDEPAEDSVAEAPAAPSRAESDILAERASQRDRWGVDHDDEYGKQELARAAMAYITGNRKFWPFADGFKPRSRREDLVRAGALVIAEIERVDRAAESFQAPEVRAMRAAEAPGSRGGSAANISTGSVLRAGLRENDKLRARVAELEEKLDPRRSHQASAFWKIQSARLRAERERDAEKARADAAKADAGESMAGLLSIARQCNEALQSPGPDYPGPRDAVCAVIERMQAAEAREKALLEALDSVRIFGSDTLSGRVDGPVDVAWYRDAVREMRNRANRAILAGRGPAEGGAS